MGLIQLASADTSHSSERTTSRRPTRQPDEQGGTYQPLDPAKAEEGVTLPLSSLSKEARDEAEDASDTVAQDEAAEQLQAFANIPSAFTLSEEATRLFAARRQASDAEPVVGTGGALASEALSSQSALWRARTTDKTQDSGNVRAADKGTDLAGRANGLEQMSVNRDKPVAMNTELSRLMGQQMLQGNGALSHDKAGGLPGSQVAAEGDTTTPEFKNLLGQLVSSPLPKPAEYQWAPAKLADNPAQWGQQLMDVLKDKVELQVNQQVKQAHIRLDPPDLGRLELTVRIEGDRLNVQVNANNPAVRDALIQSMEKLRMSLAPHHAGGVEVNVGQGGEQGRQDQWQQDQILAGRRQWQEEAESAESSGQDWLNTLV